jgi:type IV pilus assembly protein PilB
LPNQLQQPGHAPASAPAAAAPGAPAASGPAAAAGAHPAAAAEIGPTGGGILNVKVPVPSVEAFLSRAVLFRKCDPAIITKVAPLFLGLECPKGAPLLQAGVLNDGLGIVFSGRVALLLPDGSEAEALHSGDHFGEAALLTGEPSPYSAVTMEPSRILWLPGAIAQSMFGKVPAITDALGRRLAAQVGRLAVMQRAPIAVAPAPVAAEAAAEAEPEPVPGQPTLGPAQPSRPVVPFVELADYDLQPAVLSLIPTKLVRLHRILPLALDGHNLTVGMVAPHNTAALSELRRTLQTVEIAVVAISQDDFNHAVTRFRLDTAVAAKQGKGPSLNPDSLVFETTAEERDPAPTRGVGDEVIRFVNRLIVAGLDREASDIHIEPTAGAPRVRFRINGSLEEWGEPMPSSAALKAVSARIKVLAGLDITERRLPQDGRIGLAAGKRDIDLRVSTLPANRGEKIVLRILESAGSTRPLEQIFFEANTLQSVRRVLNRPYGAILVGGPTGSGKTSTLYSALNERKITRPDTNIMMVEDPIEYRLQGVTQVQVNPGAGLSFAHALRAMLRQDPDVIVVGETRDNETAQLALESSMTGHLVLTSLHANNAVGGIQRLENLGCGRQLIAQSLALVLVQRLVRKLCPNCRQVGPTPSALLETLVARKVIDPRINPPLPHAVGCEACGRTGYVGRAVVVESLSITDEVRNALAAGRSLSEVEAVGLSTRALTPYSTYAAHLLSRQIISVSEALLTLAE